MAEHDDDDDDDRVIISLSMSVYFIEILAACDVNESVNLIGVHILESINSKWT